METVDLGGKERQRQTHHVEQPVWSVAEALGGHGHGRMGTPQSARLAGTLTLP